MFPESITPSLFTPPLAFGFGSGWMLWFLTAAAAPIIIHLWNKRRHREMRWAAMEYLLAAIRNNARRITLEQLILLLVRTLIVVLLAIAAAEPFLDMTEGFGGFLWPAAIGLVVVAGVLWLGIFARGPWWARSAGATALLVGGAACLMLINFSSFHPFAASGINSRRTHRVIVIDGSYSMDYKPGDKNRFEQAKDLARQIVEESLLGDGFTLILMAEPPHVTVGTPVFDRADFLDELGRLRMPHAGGDLAAALARVEEVLQTARREHPKLVRHEVHIVSDLGRTTWNLPSRDAQAAFRRQAAKLTESAGLIVYDVGQPEVHNLAVTSAQMVRSRSDAPVKFATIRHDATFRFDLRNFGSQEAVQQVVELHVDGRKASDTTLDVPGHGQASGRFTYHFDAPGDHAVEIRLASDPLQVDNSRFLSVPVRAQLKVLCIDGRPSGDAFSSATGYLRQALRDAPLRDASEGRISAEVETERALRERDLEQYDAIFLCNVAQFNQEEAAALHKYVSRGGGLVTFLGERVQAESYNLGLGGGGKLPRVLPAQLGGIVSRESEKAFAAASDTFRGPFEHEIVRIFQTNPDVRFANTPVDKWFKLRLNEETKDEGARSRAQVVLRFANDDPAIVEERIGRGRSILVATTADLGPPGDYWTILPTTPNFLPLVRELLSAAVVGQFEKRNLTVGDSLSGETGLLGPEARVAVKTPWNATEQVPLRLLDDHGQWSFADTERRGIYLARVPGGETRDIAFAVNVNTRESDLAKVSAAELNDEVLAGVKFSYLTSWQGLEDRPAAVGVQRQFYDVWLLVAVCGLLFAETFLAWWFGRHGT
jgi:hypothetical protein